jgi:putative ATPase
VTYLATAPKSNASYSALLAAKKDAKEKGNLPVPLHLRNAVTSLMKDLDYGKDYRYAHDDPKGAKNQTRLPKELEGRRYYRPTGSPPPPDDEEGLNAPW